MQWCNWKVCVRVDCVEVATVEDDAKMACLIDISDDMDCCVNVSLMRRILILS